MRKFKVYVHIGVNSAKFIRPMVRSFYEQQEDEMKLFLVSLDELHLMYSIDVEMKITVSDFETAISTKYRD